MTKSVIGATALALTISQLTVTEAQDVSLLSSSIVNQTTSIPFSTLTTFVPVATICSNSTNSTALNGTALNTTTTASSDPTKSTATGASGCNTYFTQTELCSTTLTGMDLPPITVTSCSQYVTFSTSTRTPDSSTTGATTRYAFLAPWQNVAAAVGVPGSVEVMECTGANETDYNDEGDDSDCDVWNETWVLWEQYFESKVTTTATFEGVITGPANVIMPSFTSSITATTPTSVAIADVYTITKTIVVPSIQRIVATTAAPAAATAAPDATTATGNIFVTTESNGYGTMTITYTVNSIGQTSTLTIHSTSTTTVTATTTIPASTLSWSGSGVSPTPKVPIPVTVLNSTVSAIATASPTPLSFNPGGPLIPLSSSSDTITSSTETAVPSVVVQNAINAAATTTASTNGTLDGTSLRNRRYMKQGTRMYW